MESRRFGWTWLAGALVLAWPGCSGDSVSADRGATDGHVTTSDGPRPAWELGGGGDTSAGKDAVIPTGGKGVVGASGVAGFDALSAGQLGQLKQAKIFFGHNSVGVNLMDGAAELGLPFTDDVTGPTPYTSGGLARGAAVVDSNGDPLQKVQSFHTLVVDNQIGSVPGLVAGFKLCYVDFSGGDDLAALKAAYQAEVSSLRGALPQLKLVHFTVPLTSDDADANKVRLQFGGWVKSQYQNESVVVDLADVESTSPSGSRCHSSDNASVDGLCAEYTDDGGHPDTGGGGARLAKALLFGVARLTGIAP